MNFHRLALAVLLAVLSCTATVAAQQMPLRIARFPWQVMSPRLPEATLDYLDTRLDQELHVPLNGILQRAAYLPEDECLAALEKTTAASDKKSRPRDWLPLLADRLDADLIVYPTVEVMTFATAFLSGRMMPVIFSLSPPAYSILSPVSLSLRSVHSFVPSSSL